MAFDTDIFTGCTGLLNCMATWANSVTFGAFWTIILVAFCIVIFMATSRYGANRAFGFATFSGGLASVFLLLGGLMPWYITSLFIVLTGVGIVVMRMSER